MPGHGTVPGALTRVEWSDWLAAARLALREGRRRAGADGSVHLVGYSNGGALSVKLAADALEDPSLPRADRIVLVSPMIGITEFARFSGLAGLPAILPAFAKAAWLDVLPEFNPFKYNSFPVNGARQSYELTRALQQQVAGLAASGHIDAMPPVLAFQSVVDATVSTPAVVDALFRHLPANGSELVLFDLNRMHALQPLMQPEAMLAPARLLPPAPRRYRVRFVTNASEDAATTVERITQAGETAETVRATGLAWPPLVYSLSHVALPFPVSDSLYGLAPDRRENYGLNLGTLVVRGERDLLAVGLPLLLRLQSNPFYPYLAARIEQEIMAPRR
jgi:alpha-beta hydrolase superfamily lysophospholipase